MENTHAKTRNANSASPTWWLFFTRELAELWIGGKALILILVYSILLGVTTYVMASNSELSLIPANEMVYETLKDAIAVGLFIGLIIGADMLSGERERSTFEALLLTPTSRRQIVVGKFLAAITPWPAALLITLPTMAVLAQGDQVLATQAMLWGAILGSVLAPAYTGLGMFVSFWANSNKTSYLVSLGIYVLFLVPSQLPGRAQVGPAGQFLQWVNPLAAINHFLSKILVNNRTVDEYATWLISPVLLLVLVVVLLVWYAGPRLRLDGGISRKNRLKGARIAGLFLIAGLIVVQSVAPTFAFGGETDTKSFLKISVDLESKEVKAGDHILFNTTVTNTDQKPSPPLIMAMNIINLDAEGEIVDPEDWSPQRTQYIKTLTPGASAQNAWRVNAILEGNYMIYMVVIPEPAGKQTTSQPVASSGIHLTVTPFTRLNPGGVLPFAIGGPAIVGLVIFLVYRYRRRQIDFGGSAEESAK